MSKDIKARLRCFLIITVPSDSRSEMLKGFLTKVKVVKHKTHRYFLFLHDAMCNEMLSKTTSSRRSGIIHARQLGLCTRWFGQHWKHRCINIFQEEISKLQVFLQISFHYLQDNNSNKDSPRNCDIWDTDYNSDNWEPEFMTIFVICK